MMLAAIKALSYTEERLVQDYKAERKLDDVLHPKQHNKNQRTWRRRIVRDGYSIPIKLYFPEKVEEGNLLVYIHGGGFVKGSNQTYSQVCTALANATQHTVLSVEYRLAPEYPFPTGLEDCYEVVQHLLTYPDLFGVKAEAITLIGDSAGANLIAALSLLIRERKGKQVRQQILIYPLLYNNHTKTSPYRSMQDNAEGYLLTEKRINHYIDLYLEDKTDLENPYFAPLLAQDLSKQPDTLIITAEYDPLRDEGEDYAKRLQEAGNDVWCHRVADSVHGYFSLPPAWGCVRETYEVIKSFLVRNRE